MGGFFTPFYFLIFLLKLYGNRLKYNAKPRILCECREFRIVRIIRRLRRLHSSRVAGMWSQSAGRGICFKVCKFTIACIMAPRPFGTMEPTGRELALWLQGPSGSWSRRVLIISSPWTFHLSPSYAIRAIRIRGIRLSFADSHYILAKDHSLVYDGVVIKDVGGM